MGYGKITYFWVFEILWKPFGNPWAMVWKDNIFPMGYGKIIFSWVFEILWKPTWKEGNSFQQRFEFGWAVESNFFGWDRDGQPFYLIYTPNQHHPNSFCAETPQG